MRRFVLVLLVGAALAAPLAGCFNPQQPPCAFSCGPAGECPEAYVCGADLFCHRADGVGKCLLEAPDAGSDHASGDTGNDSP